MQPKFTLGELGNFGRQCLMLTLALVLSISFAFSQSAQRAARTTAQIEAKKAIDARGGYQRIAATNDKGVVVTQSGSQGTSRIEAVCATFTGSFAAGDPTFNTGRLNRDGVASTCAAPKTCPGNFGAGSVFRYKTYTFTEGTGASQCITMTHNNTGAAGSPHVSIHSGPFDPASICTNYLADEGSSPNPTFNLVSSFTLPANATVTILVTETVVGAGGTWSITLDGNCAINPPCSGTPNPGNTVAPASVCAGVAFNLSVQNNPAVTGLTFTWQRSTAGAAGPYTTFGTTAPTQSVTQTVPTWYKATVSCGVNQGTSNVAAVAMNAATACYCTPPNSDCTDDDVITNVTLGTLNNTTTCSAGPPLGYGNYLSLAAPDVLRGVNNTISVTVPVTYTESVGVWIDYNQNGAFENSEFTLIGSNAAGGTIVKSIAVPADALLGTTRMRVRDRFSTTVTGADACAAFTYGETEDYLVNIKDCVPAAFSTQPVSASVQCNGTAVFTAAATGSIPTWQWQTRANSSATWTTLVNSATVSGATTNTLTVSGVSASMSGAQYRVLLTGACAAVDFSTIATLTVTPLVATITPTSALICAGSIQSITLTNIASPTKLIDEQFETAVPLPTGWASQNLSSPIGLTGWSQGAEIVFPAQSGTPTSYISANFNNTTGANTISNWLFTPVITMKNGDVLKFWSRSAGTYADRLEVRQSLAGASVNAGATSTSVGDFTTVLTTINSALTPTGYPTAWTEYTVTISGLASPTSGRLAFRYFVTNGGPTGANSNYIGIDNITYTAGGVAAGTWSATPSSANNTIYTNAGATVPYVTGSLATTVYVKPTATTTYSVVYAAGSCTSAPTNVVVTVASAATGLAVTPTRAICVGASTTFVATATGGGPLTYQWQVSSDGGANYTDISGATSATLSLGSVTQSMNNNRYRVVTTSAPCAGTVASAPGVLTVNPLPTVTLTAPSVSLTPGQTTTITTSSTPAASTYVYTLNGNTIVGANTNSVGVNIDQLGDYQVKVTDVNGCVNTSSVLTIGGTASDRLWIYPNPTDGQFQVRLYNSGNPTERREVSVYSMSGARVASKTFTLTNANGPYLRMDFDLTAMGAGTYVVKVADHFGAVITSGLVVIQ